MIWFERYGIPGTYCVILFIIIFSLFLGSPLKHITINNILGFAILGSIPVGYILVIISQLLYYKFPKWPLRVHSISWNNVCNEEIDELCAEAKITIFSRVEGRQKTEQGRWIQDWFTKRFDVMSINSAIFLSNIIALLFGIFMMIYEIIKGNINCTQIKIFELISFFILVISIIVGYSSYILKEQSVKIETKYLEILVKNNY